MIHRTAGKYHITGSILDKNKREEVVFFLNNARFALSRDVCKQPK
jgi:hypothetical protein